MQLGERGDVRQVSWPFVWPGPHLCEACPIRVAWLPTDRQGRRHPTS
jgi:hypothetical protein